MNPYVVFWILVANLVATLFMTGVIWFVQVVHYPLFARVGEAGYITYQNLHAQRTTWVVGPAMLVELATSALLLVQPPPGVALWQTGLGLALVGMLWLSTFLLQVPRHAALGEGFDGEAHRLLVRTNWLRTVVWTLRAFLVLWMLAEAALRNR